MCCSITTDIHIKKSRLAASADRRHYSLEKAMKIKYILLASVVALSGISSANAADAIQYQEPAPAIVTPSFSWTGGYAGVHFGYGWGDSDYTYLFNDGELKPNGFLGGVYAGYNFALENNVVLGVDADITYNNIKKDHTISSAEYETELLWSGAVRARAGYAIDRFLPYLAGGVAFGQVKNSYGITVLNSTYSDKETLAGWTIGAGLDYAATDNLILRVEYRYTDFGSKDFDFGGAEGVSYKLKTNDIRVGIAYKF